MKRLGILLVVGAAMLATASVAGAAQRYASPAGSGTTCASASPCSLAVAIEEANGGDEVIIGGGEYSVEKTISGGSRFEDEEPVVVPNLNIHGDFAGPMPIIRYEGSLEYPFGLTLAGEGSTLSWVEVIGSGPEVRALACGGHVIVERVRVSVSESDGFEDFKGAAIQVDGECTLRDSLAIASEGATAINSYGISPSDTKATVINTTAIASGPGSIGVTAKWVDAIFLGPGSFTLDLINTIARGEGLDVFVGGYEGGTATVAASRSSFASSDTEEQGSVVDAGGNQTAPPLFVDAAAGNYAEAPGSPTIDAGITTPLAGALDFAGNARAQGASTDIGAYEVVVPAVPTITALAIKPKAFAAVNAGGAVISKKGKGGKKKKAARVGAKVTYSLAAAGPVAFRVEKALPGRKAGKKCRKPTKGNRSKKKCKRFKRVKGSFSVEGAAGVNSFKLSGRIRNKALKPGGYRLVGEAGGATKSTSFKIVK